MNRSEVYKLIDGERDYQDKRWGSTLSGNRLPTPETKGGDRTVDEFVLYISGYVDELVQKASHYSDTDGKLDIVRKVAGLCVACMEQHGAPPRC